MAALTRFGFLAIAIVFHVISFASIFDIYFVSPVVHGMRLFGVQRSESSKAPADRLVLFVGELFHLFTSLTLWVCFQHWTNFWP